MKRIAMLLCLAGMPGVVSAEDVMEFKNKKGTIFFPHKRHQRLAAGDCKVCHEYPGAIKDFGKEAAHRLCIGCHQPEPGKLEGPVHCDGCHSAK